MSNASRPDLSQLLRSPFTASQPSSDWTPNDPHSAWESVRPSVGFAVSPSAAILQTIPSNNLYGRFVKLPERHGHGYNPSTPHVILSLRESVAQIPPHPGIRPTAYDEFTHPNTVYFDGSHGPYEARKYPQEVDHRRPWYPFHLFPEIGTHQAIEYYDVGYFFNSAFVRQNNFTGGQWSIGDIEHLFRRRAELETYLLKVVSKCSRGVDTLRREFGTSLPFQDNLDMEQVRSWKNWMDGRDALGRTLRYTCELMAIAQWLKELHRQKSNEPSASNKRFIGAWVGGIENEEMWAFMTRSPVPLYGLFAMSTAHSLYQVAQRESIDQWLHADEIHRLDAFTTRIAFPRLRRSSYIDRIRITTGVKYPTPETRRARDRTLAPQSLSNLLPPGGRFEGKEEYISYRVPWTSYLFLDRQIYRPNRQEVTDFSLSPLGKQLNREWRKLISATTVVPPPTLPDGLSPLLKIHPIVQFLPKRQPNDHKKRVFREENKGCCFWPVKVGRTRARSDANLDGEPLDLGNGDLLFTEFHWPTVDSVLSPSGDSDSYPRFDPNVPRRVYMRHQPTDVQRGKMPEAYFTAEPPQSLERQWHIQPGSTRQTAMQKPYLQEEDGDDDTFMEIYPGILPRGRQYATASSQPTVSTFSTGQLSTPHENGSMDVHPAPQLSSAVPQDSSEISGPTGLLRHVADISPNQDEQPVEGLSVSHRQDRSRHANGRHRQLSPRRLRSSRSRSPRRGEKASSARRPPSPDSSHARPPVVLQQPARSPAPSDDMEMLDGPMCPQSQLPQPSLPVASSPAIRTSALGLTGPPKVALGEGSTAVQRPEDPILFTSTTPPIQNSLAPADAPSDIAHTTTWQNHDLVAIRECRLRANAYVLNRLNVSRAPSTKCASLIGAHLRHQTIDLHVVCYPLRFENVFFMDHSSESAALTLVQAFLDILEDSFGDVVLLSLYREADGSSTVDAGFRFVDQALCAWQKDGFEHAGHYWKVSPITSIHGHCCMVRPRTTHTQTVAERVTAVQSRLELESYVQACNVTDPITDAVSAQMKELLLEFSTIDVQTCAISSSGDYPTVDGSPPCLLVEIQPHATPSAWTIQPAGSTMFAWMSHWTLPRYDVPPPSERTGRNGRRARKKQQLPKPIPGADPASLRLDIPMDRYEVHLAYRTTYQEARTKWQLWQQPAGEIQMPSLPLSTLAQNETTRDKQNAYTALWRWYDECVAIVDTAYEASGLGSSSAAPSLQDLPIVSTSRQRVDTVRHMSYNALRNALSARERLYGLYGEEYSSVMMWVSSM